MGHDPAAAHDDPGTDDDRFQSAARLEFSDDRFGGDLRARVGAALERQGIGALFLGDRSRAAQIQRGNRAGIEEPLNTGVDARGRDRPRRLDEIPFVVAPRIAAARRHVDDVGRAGHGARDGRRVGHRSHDMRHARMFDRRNFPPADGANLVPLGDQSPHQRLADESGSAEDGDHCRCHRITAAWFSSAVAIASRPIRSQTSTRCAARRVRASPRAWSSCASER